MMRYLLLLLLLCSVVSADEVKVYDANTDSILIYECPPGIRIPDDSCHQQTSPLPSSEDGGRSLLAPAVLLVGIGASFFTVLFILPMYGIYNAFQKKPI